ncbi:hypothetical protein C8J56DRAFT_892315 [Mycena floridula]|nr:hypothetical protein C8J56DRAFT_892315 [Mycena floridula]
MPAAPSRGRKRRNSNEEYKLSSSVKFSKIGKFRARSPASPVLHDTFHATSSHEETPTGSSLRNNRLYLVSLAPANRGYGPAAMEGERSEQELLNLETATVGVKDKAAAAALGRDTSSFLPVDGRRRPFWTGTDGSIRPVTRLSDAPRNSKTGRGRNPSFRPVIRPGGTSFGMGHRAKAVVAGILSPKVDLAWGWEGESTLGNLR